MNGAEASQGAGIRHKQGARHFLRQRVVLVFAGSWPALIHYAIGFADDPWRFGFSSSETISRRSGTKARPRLPSR